jgi:aspartyl-tRNA synthetase
MAQEVMSSNSGWAGWTGMASLGGVLAWLFFHHIPAERASHERMFDKTLALVRERDQQLMEMSRAKDTAVAALVDSFRTERDSDRESRHDALNRYQAQINEAQLDYRKTLNQIQVTCLEEMKLVRTAEDSRTAAMNKAFEERNRDVVLVLKEQTDSFVAAVNSLRETLITDLSIRRKNEKEEKP